jgi:hypothetical protein
MLQVEPKAGQAYAATSCSGRRFASVDVPDVVPSVERDDHSERVRGD